MPQTSDTVQICLEDMIILPDKNSLTEITAENCMQLTQQVNKLFNRENSHRGKIELYMRDPNSEWELKSDECTYFNECYASNSKNKELCVTILYSVYGHNFGDWDIRLYTSHHPKYAFVHSKENSSKITGIYLHAGKDENGDCLTAWGSKEEFLVLIRTEADEFV